MIARVEIAIGAFFLAIGSAGPPLELPHVLLGALVCAIISISGRFIGSVAMAATILAGWLQHQPKSIGEFRLTLLVSATLLGIVTHFSRTRPKFASAIMAAGAVAGLALLFFG